MKLRDAHNENWVYSYNGAGQLTQVSAPEGPPRTWTYLANGLLATETHPESGTTEYHYNSAGVLTHTVDARGLEGIIHYSYDANGRLAGINAPGAADDIALSYDEFDRPIAAVNAAGTVEWAYDTAGRLIATTFSYSDTGDRLSSGSGVYSYDPSTRRLMQISGGLTGNGSFTYTDIGSLETDPAAAPTAEAPAVAVSVTSLFPAARFVELEEPVTFQAIPTVASGSITRVDFFVNGALVGSDSSGPFEVTRGDLPTGLHHVVARVVASTGTASSTAVGFEVYAVPRVTAVSVSPAVPVIGQVATVNVTGRLQHQRTSLGHLQAVGLVRDVHGDGRGRETAPGSRAFR